MCIGDAGGTEEPIMVKEIFEGVVTIFFVTLQDLDQAAIANANGTDLAAPPLIFYMSCLAPPPMGGRRTPNLKPQDRRSLPCCVRARPIGS